MVMNLNRQVLEIGLWWATLLYHPQTCLEGMRRLRNVAIRKVGSLAEIPTGYVTKPAHSASCSFLGRNVTVAARNSCPIV
jgi:hypothetical protein